MIEPEPQHFHHHEALNTRRDARGRVWMRSDRVIDDRGREGHIVKFDGGRARIRDDKGREMTVPLHRVYACI